MQGGQSRNADGWTNNPLSGILGPFMSSTIPSVFGPQNIPFLSLVTLTTGLGNNALAAIPTIGLATPFQVITNITGEVTWQLVAGVFSGPGYIAPNDQTTSQKTWKAVA